jgi:hypothetical protein
MLSNVSSKPFTASPSSHGDPLRSDASPSSASTKHTSASDVEDAERASAKAAAHPSLAQHRLTSSESGDSYRDAAMHDDAVQHAHDTPDFPDLDPHTADAFDADASTKSSNYSRWKNGGNVLSYIASLAVGLAIPAVLLPLALLAFPLAPLTIPLIGAGGVAGFMGTRLGTKWMAKFFAERFG